MKKKVFLFFMFSLVMVVGCPISVQAANADSDTRALLNVGDPSVVRLGNPNDPDVFGTGTFIAPNKILTAAHVAEGLEGTITAYPAQHLSYTPAPLTTTRVDVHPLYKQTGGNPEYDLAVVTVAEKSPFYYSYQLVLPGLLTLTDNYRWFGYPFDLNYNFDQLRYDYNQFGDSGKADGYEKIGRVLRFDKISAQGQSGSPLVSNRNGNVIGALYGGTRGTTKFTLLTGENYAFVNKNVKN